MNERQKRKETEMPDSATEMSKQHGICRKKFRNALRQESFPWRCGKKHSRWNPPDGSPEHRDMVRVAERIAAGRGE